MNERLGGSLASVLYCLEQGVDIFRVHDVKETSQAIKIYKEIKCSQVEIKNLKTKAHIGIPEKERKKHNH